MVDSFDRHDMSCFLVVTIKEPKDIYIRQSLEFMLRLLAV